jgi:hypothetical protein
MDTDMAHVPLQTVRPPGTQGAIGMVPCPGRRDEEAQSADWRADFETDLARIAAWQPQLVIALLAPSEFVRPALPEFQARVTELGLPWEYAPVGNYGVPDTVFMQQWVQLGERARAILQQNGRIILHCRYGLGRTGLVAAMLLIELGSSATESIDLVRAARPHTIQNGRQLDFVQRYAPHDGAR